MGEEEWDGRGSFLVLVWIDFSCFGSFRGLLRFVDGISVIFYGRLGGGVGCEAALAGEVMSELGEVGEVFLEFGRGEGGGGW